VSDITDRELDLIVKENESRPPPPPPRMAGPPPPQRPDEFERDPWNAVAVVGLRIYYKVAEEDKDAEGLVTLRVVRPNRWELMSDDEENGADGEGGEVGEKETAEEAKAEGEGLNESLVLDVDDSAKDAMVKGG
jgi:hypothetical protein